MKNLKRILSLVLAVMMVFGTISAVAAANVTFTDVSSHWAWKNGQIPYLVEKGVINGYKENNGTSTFRPEVAVTRAEFIKMLDETFGLTKEAAVNFKDVKSSDWFYKYYLRAKAQGYLLNYGTTANPNGYITREEATSLLVRYLALPGNNKAPASTFTDYNKVTTYYKDYILMAVSAGIINGYKEDNGTYTFRPQNTLTRAEALTVLYRAAGCIFNANSYSRDTGAPATNNVITKGGIVIQNVTFKGRNIITEGATSGNITFSNCKFEGPVYIRGTADVTFDNCQVGEVYSLGGGKIFLSNKTVINSLILATKTPITGYAGTNIVELRVRDTAANSTHTGSGTITNAIIDASGFKSTTIPTTFDIGSGLTATFASATYTGTSTAGDAFTLYPFASLDSNYYYINLISSESGDVYYYYTNDESVPSASDFDSYHAESDYAGAFDIKYGEHTSEKTYSAANVKKFSYVVLQLQVDDELYAPVIISNEVATDSGFKVAPHVDPDNSKKISLQTSISGTLYWFYTNEGNQFSQMQFLEAYEDTESALRGEQTLTGNKQVSCTLDEKYLKNYDYVAFMYQAANGMYYIPVIVTVGDNGFSKVPEIASLGVIEFTPSVNGTLYFYYSDTDVLPTAKTFLDEYNSAKLRKSVEVKKRVLGEIKYDLDQIEDYPYIIFAIRSATGDFLAPYAVSIDLTTGFKKLPTSVDGDYVTFKTEESGTVRWYYSNSDSVPSIEEFNETYGNMIPKLTCGTVLVTANVTSEINYTASAAEYRYIVLMLTDSEEKEYFPVITELDITTAMGFKTAPFISSGKVYYEVQSKGEVWYYYTTSGSSTNATTFKSTWWGTSDELKGANSVDSGSILSFDLPSDAIKARYELTHVAIAFYDPVKDKYGVPVVISIEEIATNRNSGIEETIVTKDNITITVNEDGTLYYYFTNDGSSVPKRDFLNNHLSADKALSGEMYVRSSNSYTIPINEDYDYIVIGIDKGIGEMLIPMTISVSTPSGTGTSSSNGFEYDRSDLVTAMTNHTLDITPHVDGTVYITIIYDGVSVSGGAINVKQNTKTTLDWASAVKMYSAFASDITIKIQLKSASTDYKELSINAIW